MELLVVSVECNGISVFWWFPQITFRSFRYIHYGFYLNLLGQLLSYRKRAEFTGFDLSSHFQNGVVFFLYNKTINLLLQPEIN